METFSAGSCIRMGWDTFWKRPWFLIGVPCLATIIYFAANEVLGEAAKLGLAVAILALIANAAFSIVYQMGSLNFKLQAAADISGLQMKDYWHPESFWSYLGASILMFLCSMLAFVAALVVAGIVAGIVYFAAGSQAGGVAFLIVIIIAALVGMFYVLTTFLFPQYLVIAKGIYSMEAMKESARMTKGHRLQLLWLLILCLLVNIVGVICLIVGLFVTVPVTSLALVYAYRSLSHTSPAPVA